ncbi:MAG: AbrB/MazE/SpoVT family DNA-binding domain-containing protein [Patescibacteria group bacterium]
MISTTLTMSSQGQLTIPRSMRKILDLEPGQKILAWIQKKSQSNELVITKKPKNWTQHMAGLGKEIWQDIDVDKYIRKERQSWEK